jgi:dipeptide/tripeptide permease
MAAFSLLGIGYFLTSQMNGYAGIFISLVIMGVGAGTFKPVISGTIAKVTDERTSSLGFGIFYWSINLGAFLVPLIIVPLLKVYDESLKAYDCSNIFLYAAIATGAMLIPTLLIYKEPPRDRIEKESLGKTIAGILEKVLMVVLDWKFILFIFIYSIFWILYFQMFGTVLWYVKDFVDAASLNNFVNNIFANLHTFFLDITGNNWFSGMFLFKWEFDVEHVTVINAGTIILLQFFISNITKKTKALPTLVTGISFGTIGMAILAFSSNIWVFILGITIFSLGEMTAHPKFISYLGTIAPADKKATYMGFGFLYGVFGASIASLLGGFLYPMFIKYPMLSGVNEKLSAAGSALLTSDVKVSEIFEAGTRLNMPQAEVALYAYASELWILFSCIGALCIAGLLFYAKFIGTRQASDLN